MAPTTRSKQAHSIDTQRSPSGKHISFSAGAEDDADGTQVDAAPATEALGGGVEGAGDQVAATKGDERDDDSDGGDSDEDDEAPEAVSNVGAKQAVADASRKVREVEKSKAERRRAVAKAREARAAANKAARAAEGDEAGEGSEESSEDDVEMDEGTLEGEGSEEEQGDLEAETSSSEEGQSDADTTKSNSRYLDPALFASALSSSTKGKAKASAARKEGKSKRTGKPRKAKRSTKEQEGVVRRVGDTVIRSLPPAATDSGNPLVRTPAPPAPIDPATALPSAAPSRFKRKALYRAGQAKMRQPGGGNVSGTNKRRGGKPDARTVDGRRDAHLAISQRRTGPAFSFSRSQA